MRDGKFAFCKKAAMSRIYGYDYCNPADKDQNDSHFDKNLHRGTDKFVD